LTGRSEETLAENRHQAERDPKFKAQMLDALDRILTDPDDRVLFSLPCNPPPGI
jgi:hypothetical protein